MPWNIITSKHPKLYFFWWFLGSTYVKIQLKGCFRMEINSNAFAIPIMTTSGCTWLIVDNVAVRIGIANTLESFYIL